jgi:hypothetical protein
MYSRIHCLRRSEEKYGCLTSNCESFACVCVCVDGNTRSVEERNLKQWLLENVLLLLLWI